MNKSHYQLCAFVYETVMTYMWASVSESRYDLTLRIICWFDSLSYMSTALYFCSCLERIRTKRTRFLSVNAYRRYNLKPEW